MFEDKVVVVYGGGGVIGGACAQAFARAGAEVHLAGRTAAKLERVARTIDEAGGSANVAVVDALDETSVQRHVASVLEKSGRIDVVLNAIGIVHVQGTPLIELSLADYERPIHGYLRSLFVTAQAACRPMIAQRSGVFLCVSTPASKIGFAGVLGFGTACSAIEGFTRHLASDLGGHGVRALCLRPDALPEALALGSHANEVFEPVARRAGMSATEMLALPAKSALGRYPKVDEVASAAVFAASSHASAMTGAVLNLTCGSVMD